MNIRNVDTCTSIYIEKDVTPENGLTGVELEEEVSKTKSFLTYVHTPFFSKLQGSDRMPLQPRLPQPHTGHWASKPLNH